MSGSGRVALPDVREWSKGYPKCPEVVRRPYQMSRSGREALPVCLGVVGRPSQLSGKIGRSARRSGNGQDTLWDVPEG